MKIQAAGAELLRGAERNLQHEAERSLQNPADPEPLVRTRDAVRRAEAAARLLDRGREQEGTLLDLLA